MKHFFYCVMPKSYKNITKLFLGLICILSSFISSSQTYTLLPSGSASGSLGGGVTFSRIVTGTNSSGCNGRTINLGPAGGTGSGTYTATFSGSPVYSVAIALDGTDLRTTLFDEIEVSVNGTILTLDASNFSCVGAACTNAGLFSTTCLSTSTLGLTIAPNNRIQSTTLSTTQAGRGVYRVNSPNASTPITSISVTNYTNSGSGGTAVGLYLVTGDTNCLFAPQLSATTTSNLCPSATVNLNSLVTSTPVSGSSLVWFTNNTHTGIAVADPTAVSIAGTYYAFYYATATNCYTPASSAVTVNIATCCSAGTTAPTLASTPQANVCPDTTVNLTTITASNLPASTTLTWHTGTPATTANKILGSAVTAGTYYAAFFDAASDCYSPTTEVTPTVVSCVAVGTIDCSKTQITTIPVLGEMGQKSLVVTINVTQVGCFTPLSVSGSGMSLANAASSVCTTTTGIQQFVIPTNYDGTALGTMTFTVGSAGSCSADLTSLAGKKKVITDVWTLENCSLIQVGPSLK